MKKYILTLAVLVLGLIQVAAQRLYVDDVVEIPRGGAAKVAIKYNTEGKTIKGFGIAFVLPDGIETVKNDAGEPDYEIDPSNPGFRQLAAANDGWSGVTTSGQFTGTEGTIFYAYLTADSSLPLNSEHQVTVNKLMVTVAKDDGKNESVYLDDFNFTVKIVNYVTLDEESTSLPLAAENINAKVNRTITADRWSTVCFPFAMSQEQCTEVFGSDAQIATLDNWLIADYDENTLDIFTITVNFKNLSKVQMKQGLKAGQPYLIKTTKDIAGFELVGVTIALEKSDVQVNESGDWEEPLKLVGTFNKTKVPAKRMFLSDNKFYYSKGLTTIKGFRAWFDFGDNVLAAYENGGSVKMQVNVDGIPTHIDNLQIVDSNEGIFTIDGKKLDSNVDRLQKGVYIINGKKVAVNKK